MIISLVFFVYISALQSCWGQTIINRLYKDEKNFTSVLSFCIGPKCVSSNDDRKALILHLHIALLTDFYKSNFKSSADKQKTY